jgi:hypothetical protein
MRGITKVPLRLRPSAGDLCPLTYFTSPKANRSAVRHGLGGKKPVQKSCQLYCLG